LEPRHSGSAGDTGLDHAPPVGNAAVPARGKIGILGRRSKALCEFGEFREE